jgi:hypothetical protein
MEDGLAEGPDNATDRSDGADGLQSRFRSGGLAWEKALEDARRKRARVLAERAAARTSGGATGSPPSAAPATAIAAQAGPDPLFSPWAPPAPASAPSIGRAAARKPGAGLVLRASARRAAHAGPDIRGTAAALLVAGLLLQPFRRLRAATGRAATSPLTLPALIAMFCIGIGTGIAMPALMRLAAGTTVATASTAPPEVPAATGAAPRPDSAGTAPLAAEAVEAPAAPATTAFAVTPLPPGSALPDLAPQPAAPTRLAAASPADGLPAGLSATDGLRAPNGSVAGALAKLGPLHVQVHAPASLPEDELAKIAAILDQSGFANDDAIRVRMTIRESNVRFYHPEDAAAAGQVASLTGAVARDFTGYRPRPEPGTIELWLEGSSTRRARTADPIGTILRDVRRALR